MADITMFHSVSDVVPDVGLGRAYSRFTLVSSSLFSPAPCGAFFWVAPVARGVDRPRVMLYGAMRLKGCPFAAD